MQSTNLGSHQAISLKRIRSWWVIGLLVVFTLVVAACQPLQMPADSMEVEPDPTEASMGDPEAGAYIFSVATGCGCHFNRDLGVPAAGGNKFEGGYGVVYAPNLTPHEETGLGSWSDQEIVDAIRLGVRPEHIHGGHEHEGDQYLFIMPKYNFSDKDAMNLVAYLRSLDPVENATPARELNFEVEAPAMDMTFPAEAPTDPAERGAYLASVVSCGRCHTPKNDDGSPNMDLLLAGAPLRDTVAPNLTPDEATGLGGWSEEAIAEFLQTGIYSDGTEAHAAMKGIIDRGWNQLTDEDALAVAAWLKSLPAIENLPEPSE